MLKKFLLIITGFTLLAHLGLTHGAESIIAHWKVKYHHFRRWYLTGLTHFNL